MVVSRKWRYNSFLLLFPPSGDIIATTGSSTSFSKLKAYARPIQFFLYYRLTFSTSLYREKYDLLKFIVKRLIKCFCDGHIMLEYKMLISIYIILSKGIF